MNTCGDNQLETFVLRCAWLIAPGQRPRQNVRISVENGITAEIVPVPPDERSMIKPVAVMPQFVNAHTHLEFSQLQSPLPPPSPFTDWILSVIRNRSSVDSPDSVTESVQQGLSESQQHGVAVIGEITTSPHGYTALTHPTDGIESVVSFRELIGFTEDRIEQQLNIAGEHLSKSNSETVRDRHVIRGLSPHAPYSVHPDLFSGLVKLAKTHGCPVAMHLAETSAEVELIAHQKGPFVDFLKHMGIWQQNVLRPGTTAMDYLKQLAEIPNALAIHGNYFSCDEVKFVSEHPNIAVVYCPRTHAWFGHKNHPWEELIHLGATVVLGTDSRASNPDLSIWKELQFVARKNAAIPIWELLPMITTTAAEALGLLPTDFSMAIGHAFRAVEVPCHSESDDQLNETLRSGPSAPKSINPAV